MVAIQIFFIFFLYRYLDRVLVCCLLGAAGVHRQGWCGRVFRRICCNNQILGLTQCSDLGQFPSLPSFCLVM